MSSVASTRLVLRKESDVVGRSTLDNRRIAAEMQIEVNKGAAGAMLPLLAWY